MGNEEIKSVPYIYNIPYSMPYSMDSLAYNNLGPFNPTLSDSLSYGLTVPTYNPINMALSDSTYRMFTPTMPNYTFDTANTSLIPSYPMGGMYAPHFMGNTTLTATGSKAPTAIDTTKTVTTPETTTSTATTTQELQPEEKEGMSTWSKIGIGILITTAIAGITLFVDHRFNGGQLKKKVGDWFKNLRKAKPEGEKPKTEKLTAEKPASETPKPEVKTPKSETPIKTPDVNSEGILAMENLEKHSKEQMKSYNSLQEGITDYRAALAREEYEASRDAETLLNSLVKHNYGKEKSYIEITTRTKFKDYNSRVVDVENSILHKTRILPEGIRRKVDFSGSYLITTLPDGKKLVGISIPSGRVDEFKRPIRTKISIISKDNEFTPMQKDLIEVISTWKNTEAIKDSSGSNILSLGILSSTKQTQRNAYDINQEILLSSLKTAKEQVNGKVDNEFVQKALNLKIGEELGQSISG